MDMAFGIGGGQDERRRSAALRNDGAKNVSPLVALVAWRTRPYSSLGPVAGQRPLLANAGFVLEPDFDGLSFARSGSRAATVAAKLFKAFWGFSSACG